MKALEASTIVILIVLIKGIAVDGQDIITDIVGLTSAGVLLTDFCIIRLSSAGVAAKQLGVVSLCVADNDVLAFLVGAESECFP